MSVGRWPFSGIDDGQLSEYSVECPVYGRLVAQTNTRGEAALNIATCDVLCRHCASALHVPAPAPEAAESEAPVCPRASTQVA
jgi:hypothetical protein